MSEQLEKSDQEAAAVATGPRVTYDDLKASTAAVAFLNAGDAAIRCGQEATPSMHLLTLCILTTTNGFTVVGKSACAYPENYDAELGRKLAQEDAERQLWAFLGFELRSRLTASEA